MERDKKQFSLIAWTGVLLLFLMMVTVLSVFLTASLTDSIAFADMETVTVTASTAAVAPTATETHGSKTWHLVTTAGHFKHALRDTADDKFYLLKKNFVITDNTWSNGSNYVFRSEISGAEYVGGTPTGNNYTITYTPANTYASRSTKSEGGLFSTFAGTIRNVNYVFNGTLHALGTVKYGSFAGVMSGYVIDCNFESQGTILLYGNSDDRVVTGGGFFGDFTGTVSNSTLTLSGGVDVRNYYVPDEDSENNNARHNKLYAGGIAGRSTGSATLYNVDANIYGAVNTTDSTRRNLGAYNNDDALFPSGGVVATVNSLVITESRITINGYIYANGGLSCAKDGAIAGGVVGRVENSGLLTMTMNVIRFESRAQITARSRRQNAFTVKNGNIYKGGIVGWREGTNGNFQHNVIYQNVGTDFVDSSESDDYGDTNYRGVLIGRGTMVGWNNANFWIVRTVGGEYTSTLVQGGNTNTGTVHYLYVYGGGRVDTSFNSQQIAFEPKIQTSPFHGWLSNITNNTLHTQNVNGGIYRPATGLSSSTTVNAVFLTKQITVAGNLVQFAHEMNQGLNQAWVSVELMNNIAFEVGMPVIETWRGNFKGNNNTITFNTGTSIVGDFVSNVGMFGTIAASGRVENLNIVFSGTILAGGYDEEDNIIGSVNAGVVAGINNGTITNVSINFTQGALIDATGAIANAGAMVGINAGTIEKSKVTVDGKLFIKGYSVYVGGVIGTNNSISQFTNMNIAVRGELLASVISGGGTSIGYAGGFAGRSTGASINANYFVITVKDLSNFKNDVLRTLNASNSKTGAIAAEGPTTKILANTWLMASYEQYLDDGEIEDGPKALRLFHGDDDTYLINRIYVNGGTVDAIMNVAVTNPSIIFSVPHDSSRVFTGWFTNYNCNVMVSHDILSGSNLVPGTQSGMVYYTSVISSMVMSYDDLNTIAATTNAGQSYNGIEFILGADITISDVIVPIGTINNPFEGTFDGKSLSIILNGDISVAGQMIGLFGCIGANGQVKQLNITVNSDLGAIGITGGIIAAYNHGIIGQDSSSNKITININSEIMGNTVGGIVGINYGVIKNVEVNYNQDESDAYTFGNIYAKGLDSFGGTGANGIGGGVVGYNATNAVLKNAIVRYNVNDPNTVESIILADTSKGTAYAGGIIGYNSGAVYSAVCQIKYENDVSVVADVIYSGEGSGIRGTLIGFNDVTSSTDSLWALYVQTSVFELPVEAIPLINGKDNNIGNKLVRYGYGNIDIIIEDNNITQPSGGAITFKAVNTGVAFYNYTSNISTGTIVSAADGGSGRNFSPNVATATKAGLSGKRYFGIFVNTEIKSSADLYAMAVNINSGFSAHANYIINVPTSSELRLHPSDANYASIGASNAFVGNFNGNGYLIRFYINPAFPAQDTGFALFGTVGPTSIIQNLTYDIEFGIKIVEGKEISPGTTAAGFLANVNHGLISNVTVNATGRILGNESVANDYVGGLVGYNSGTIRNATMVYLFNNTQGVDYSGAIYGYNAGGIAGYNSGTIGNEFLDNIKVTVNNGALRPTIQGLNNVGGVVGVNDGLIQKTYTRVYGSIAAHNISAYGGGVAGTNNSIIDSATVRFYNTATVEVRGHLGGIAGYNTEGSTIGNTSVAEGIRIIMEATIETSAEAPLTRYGGVAANNSGIIYGVVSEQSSLIRANTLAGGIVGTNSGNITKVYYNLKASGRLSANITGGIAGTTSFGTLNLLNAVIEGIIGRNIGASVAGGIAGTITGGQVRNSLVYVLTDLRVADGGKKGLLAGESVQNVSFNTWAYAYNSIRTNASASNNTGFNVIKIVGNETVIGSIDATPAQPLISFRALNSPYMWYRNISTLEELGAMANNIYTPDAYIVNQVHHVSYYKLQIYNENDFFSMYQYINAYDLFNGVMFKLMTNIEINSTLQPIGTQSRQFTGIFEGNYHTITIVPGGSIAGTAYSGVFGYTSANSIIRNFIVQVDKNVILGAGSSIAAGVIVGKAEGTIQNVGLNLESKPYLVAGAQMGGFAGEIVDSNKVNNCWAVIYNQAVPVVKVGGNSGVNSIGVLGLGVMKMTFTPQHRFLVAINGAQEDSDEYYRLFDAWYANISIRQLITAVPNYTLTYGEVTVAAQNVSFTPIATAKNINVTASFISLDIESAEDFIDFANNINTYSDQGASFILKNSIEVDFSGCEPVGTAVNPFTGSFNGNGNTITIIGNIVMKSNIYTGVFGYVEESAVISNLIIRADYAERYDNPENYQGQKVGDQRSIYTGFAVSLLKGKLAQVVVVLQSETEIYNVNRDSKGGMIGKMSETAVVVNSWVVMQEHYDVDAVGGILNDGIAPPKPSVLFQSGEGLLQIYIQNIGYGWDSPDADKSIHFQAVEVQNGPNAYGFIDNKTTDEILQPSSLLITSVGDAENWNDREMLVLFLNDMIGSYNDLVNLANTINVGRNYRGVIFKQTRDIVIEPNYVPIGGQIEIASGSVGTEYKIIEFIGAYNGNGYKITVPSHVTIAGRYAGIFGIVGNQARISNLKIVAQGTVGKTDVAHSDYTRYAGFLVGLNMGASLRNVIVEVDKNASAHAAIEAGRLAGATNVSFKAIYEGESIIGWEGLNIAENCWVLVYNSQFNAVRNAAEQLFYDTLDDAIDYAILSGANSLSPQGKYNGGINVLTVIAAGEFESSFITDNVIQFLNPEATGANPNPAKEWYYYDSEGEKQELSVPNMNMYNANKDLSGAIYHVSFLDSEIDSLIKLMDLAKDTNAGYDLYGLTFNLVNDIVIDDNTYQAIGGDNGGFNATFNGNGNRLTIAEGILIEGKYAGIFGHVGEYGVIKNIIIEINGSLGKINYTTTELRDGKVRTMYAGAIAYTTGEMRNVVIVGYDAVISYVVQNEAGQEGAGGIAIGYDDTNLVYNSWVIVKASNSTPSYGRVNVGIGESSINVMKVIGMGALAVSFASIEEEYIVMLENDTTIEDGRFGIIGWYSNYIRDNQLSATLGISYYDSELGRYVPLTTGTNGSYLANPSIINSRYEVLIMATIITTVGQLESIAADVNIGGYSFDNLEFTLGAHLELTQPIKIGTSLTPFKGAFTGTYNGVYYTLTINNSSALFGYNAGIVRDMTMVLDSNIIVINGILGVVAERNSGSIINTLVKISSGVTIQGETIGGITGDNTGVIANSIVIIEEGSLLLASAYAGGIAGRNTGNIIGSTTGEANIWRQNRSASLASLLRRTGEESYENYILMATVVLLGSIEVNTDEESSVFAGGITGLSEGYAIISRTVVRIGNNGMIVGRGSNVAVGGLVGRSRASLRNSVVINEGTINAIDNGIGAVRLIYSGYFVGDISGSAINSWLVVNVPPVVTAVGNGYSSVNVLQVSGSGHIDVTIDANNTILFFDITEYGGAIIDGWYLNNNVPITDRVGNVGDGNFKPNSDIMGRLISVVYINTQLRTVQDIITMANTVNSGLYSRDIIFTLQNDITFTSANPLTVSIGTRDSTGDYGFSHIFEGNNYTITFDRNSLAVNNYLGLFGYIAASGRVRNMNVVVKSTTGVAMFGNSLPTDQLGNPLTVARYFGIIAGENSGIIENCNVTIQQNTQLNGVNVGGIVGNNTASGRIINTNLINKGLIYSQSYDSANAYAGGIAGVNMGEIMNATVTHNDTAFAIRALAHGSGSAYVGGVTGSNTSKIANIDITIANTFRADSSISGFGGGIAGSNTGTISKSYILLQNSAKIEGISKIGNCSGGIVGINVNIIADVLVNINNTGIVADSAIDILRVTAAVRNVWVYNNNTAINSTKSVVNNMTQTAEVAVSHNAKSDIIDDGIIIFFAELDASGAITMYQNARLITTDVLLENVSYQASPLSLVYTSTPTLQGISAKAVARREFNSGTELKAFSFAHNEGVATLSNEYSLGSDITLPDGVFVPIGTDARPFGITLVFNGNYHKITVTEGVTLTSIFGYNEGTIQNLAVEYARNLTGANTAGIVAINRNLGGVEDVAVYIQKGITVSNPIAFNTVSANSNAWVISYNNLEPSIGGANNYKVIVVNGDGSLKFGNKDGMSFEAMPSADATFAGWGLITSIISQETIFITSEMGANKYTAEFLSTNIDTLEKLLVLDGLLAMQYDSSGSEFNITADFTIDTELNGFKSATVFKGSIDGQGNTITITQGTGTVFGASRGYINNLIIKHNTVTARLFTSTSTVSLDNVIIYNNSLDAKLIDSVNPSFSANNVFVVTNNTGAYTSTGVGAILSNSTADMQFVFAQNITATAVEGEGQVFVGWFLGASIISNNFAYSLNNQTNYNIRFIKNTIETKEDYLKIATAVDNNFTLSGYTFTFADSIHIDSNFAQIGSASVFKGILDGAGYTLTISGADKALFTTIEGVVKNLIIIFDESCTTGVLLAEEVKAAASIENVVICVEEYLPFADIILGSVKNSWIVVGSDYGLEGEGPAGAGELIGLNTLIVDEVDVDISIILGVSGYEVRLDIIAQDAEKFIVWYDEDGLVDITTYNVLVTNDASGLEYYVTAINTIVTADEFSYLNTAVIHGYAGDVFMGADISLPNSFTTIANYSGTFNGMGYTLNISAITTDRTMFSDLSGIIKYTVVKLDTQSFITATLATGSGSVEVSAVVLNGQADFAAVINPTNVWVLTDNTYLISGFTGYMYYSEGVIVASINMLDDYVSFTSYDNDDYYFMGYEVDASGFILVQLEALYEGVDTLDIVVNAFFVPKVITNVEEWNSLAYSVNEIGSKGIDKTFTLGADITVTDELVAIIDYEGVFDGNFKTVIFADNDYTIGGAIISLAVDGAIVNLAIELKVYIGFALLPDSGVINSWIVYYEALAGVAIVEEDDATGDPLEMVLYTGGARLMQVSDGGYVEIAYSEDAFVFIPHANSAECYDLRTWSYRLDDAYVAFNDDGEEAISYYSPDAEDSFSIKVIFDKRYNVVVFMSGVPQGAIDTPTVTGSASYWADWAEPVIIEITDRGNGYIFWDFVYDAHLAISLVNAITVAIDISQLDNHIELTAEFELLAMEWGNIEYRGEGIEVSLSSVEQLTRLNNLGCLAFFSYENEANTPSLVGGLPYHSGSYLVHSVITRGGLEIGGGTSGFEISPKTLYFSKLDIANKVYNGTSVALTRGKQPIVLSGFVIGTNDKFEDLDMSGVSFEFVVYDAGTQRVRISADAKLETANDTYTYINYVLDNSAELRINGTGAFVTAQITRAPLKLSADSMIIKYLDQFVDGFNPIFEPNLVEGFVIYERDLEDFEGEQGLWRTLLGRTDPNNKNVGEYPIIVINNFAHKNYDISLTDAGARYIIRASEIDIVLNPMIMQYGDKNIPLNYRIEADGYSPELLSSFNLNLSYVLGAGQELVPVLEGEEYVYAYSVLVKYLATNTNFVLHNKAVLDMDTRNFEFDSNNRRVYLLTTTEILQVVPRAISVGANNSVNSKEFGVVAETYHGSITSGTLAKTTHRLVITREEGQRVNNTDYKPDGYRLNFAVYEGDNDVTAYYNINDAGYYYRIRKTTIRLALRSWGSSVYTYGDISAMSNMAFSPVFNRNITMQSIYEMSGGVGNNITFANMGVNLRLGYFGSGLLNVGEYIADISVNYTTGKEYLSECIDFVVDSKNSVYSVTRRHVTVTVGNVNRRYDGTSNLGNLGSVSVSGIVSADAGKVSLVVHNYMRIGTIRESAGSYYYTANCSMVASNSAYSYLLDNYTIRIVNGVFTINTIALNVNVKIGYYDEDNKFVPMKAGYFDSDIGEFEDVNTMFYADKRAIVYFEIPSIPAFISQKFPQGATDRQKQAILIEELRLQYTLPYLLPASSNKTYANAASMNSNVTANFTGNNSGFYVTPVVLSITDAKGVLRIGDLRPTISYTVIARNEFNQVIGSMTIAGDTIVYNSVQGMAYNYFEYTNEVLKTGVKKVDSDNDGEYKVELVVSVFENGEWINFSDSGGYNPDNADFMAPRAVVPIDEQSGVWVRITTFVKDNWVLVTAIGGGIAFIIAAFALIATAISRKNRIFAAATREMISKDVEKESGKSRAKKRKAKKASKPDADAQPDLEGESGAIDDGSAEDTTIEDTDSASLQEESAATDNKEEDSDDISQEKASVDTVDTAKADEIIDSNTATDEPVDNTVKNKPAKKDKLTGLSEEKVKKAEKKPEPKSPKKDYVLSDSMDEPKTTKPEDIRPANEKKPKKAGTNVAKKVTPRNKK